MKTSTFFTLGLFIVLSCTACTRTFTCRCDGGVNNGMNIDIEAKTKKQAQDECEKHNSTGLFSYHNCQVQ